MAVDGERLMTSSYLFGQEKRNVPVMELNIEDHEPIFLLYYRAMLKLITT